MVGGTLDVEGVGQAGELFKEGVGVEGGGGGVVGAD